MSGVETVVQEFREHLRKIKHYQEALAVLAWDMRTGAPKKGRARRAEAMGTLSAELFALSTSSELESYLNRLSDSSTQDQLDAITKAAVKEVKRNYERQRRIPPDRNKAMVILRSQAESVWEEAKETSDFETFRPYLEQVVEMTREFVEYYEYDDHPYDALLDGSNPGVTVAQLDGIFGELRPFLVQLNQRIQDKGAPFPPLKTAVYDKEKLREFSVFALKEMGYDFGSGRLDETVHPFEIALNLGDVRVTTKFVKDDFRPTVFGTIHEGGHALYEQGISPDLENTPLCRGTDSGLHESQSRFWENMIARSRPYWERYYSEFCKLFPVQTEGVSLDQFYFAVNEVKPDFIRIEADEVTYNLHIMLRYELEKALLLKELSVKDLPDAWRERMKDYLGVVPETDAEGVLQDVHWSSGMFGSFPSYSLGNVYAGQIRSAILRDIPDLSDKVRSGELLGIKTWLNQHIHQYGKMLTANEIVEKVSGEPVSAKYLMQYLNEKFTELYHL